jgi:hypothetical protein
MTIVSDILQQMPKVRQPPRKFLLVLFSPILALRGRVTGRNLSRYCAYSERTIARQCRATFEWPEFHQRVMTMALDTHVALISVQDASFSPKSGKQTFGLGHFFNGCAYRAERGLEISTLAVVEVSRRCAFTLAVAQTPCGKADGKPDKQAEETRMDFYKHQLHNQRHRLPSVIRYHCVDGYFAKQKYRDEVGALNLHPITKLRPDANCLLLYAGAHPKQRGRRRKYDGKVDFQDLSRFAALGTLEDKPPIPLFTAVGWQVSLKRTLRVVVLVNHKETTNPRFIVLASTAATLEGRKLVEYDVARFQIEFLCRDGKQFTGRTDCQSRAESVLNFHVTAALATLNLARAEELRHQTEPPPHVFSMASWKQRQFNERLLDVFIDTLALDPMWVKNHPTYEELITYGAIAA